MTSHPALALLIGAVLLLTACDTRESSSAAPAPAEPPAAAAEAPAPAPVVKGRLILFAPVALGQLAPIYPDAALDYARKAAVYVDLLVKDASGQASPRLPDSAAEDWKHGLPASARGAHLVVLCAVLDIRRVTGAPSSRGPTEDVSALVELRGLDEHGTLVFLKKASGFAPAASSPKFTGDINAPESLAVWQGISTCLGSLRTFLGNQQDLPAAAPREVEVAFESEPSKADVLIDGVFRGTTPAALRLPTHQLTVRIERQGYQPWQRQLTPELGMRIQPALEALPGAAPAPAAPAPAPAPAAPAPAAHAQGAAPTGK